MYPLRFHLMFSLFFPAAWRTLASPIYQYHHGSQATEAFASRSYFYVGGEYITISSNNTLFVNQMYVEHLVPSRVEQPYPIVFIHGQGMTGTVRTLLSSTLSHVLQSHAYLPKSKLKQNWLNKPDASPGWATYFISHGYEIYILDQTARGRSAWNPSGNTTVQTYPAERIMQRFTATERYGLWPQAALHTQWPGRTLGARQNPEDSNLVDLTQQNGSIGDPIFDAFYASIVQFQSNTITQETNMQTAGAALLNKIGPAVLLSHSQGGLMPWVIADKVPELVKAIVSIEPTGPPFQDVFFPPTTPAAFTRAHGITDIPLQYEPGLRVGEVVEKVLVKNQGAGEGELEECWMQIEPARQLSNLRGIKVLVETGEASYHRVYDGCTVEYLRQAGVWVEWMKLGEGREKRLSGNGHMQFLEENSDEIAGVLEGWIRSAVRGEDV
ncbi:hypothetical protein DSL72_006350 [Monilinia vaccinii-corymbosi]|uniref:AB hydrolase-1 domain-containing protein n=1 Tax=Monilinia vaccinii-corymbosi TaxID=61207 RepID=A0A8A3PNL2_9HELO|nr:hypothetical protein DSL72_006350 [Monilinia vaccinii-corymbosi]